VPEEANDQAPPEPMVEGDPAAPEDTGAAEEPPAVEAPRRGAALGQRINSRIAAVNASTKK